jgi:hypothetical protein
LFYKLLHRIGHTEEEYDGDIVGAALYHKYKGRLLAEWTGVTKLFTEMWPQLINGAMQTGSKSIDPSPFILAAYEKYGTKARQNHRIRILVPTGAPVRSQHDITNAGFRRHKCVHVRRRRG